MVTPALVSLRSSLPAAVGISLVGVSFMASLAVTRAVSPRSARGGFATFAWRAVAATAGVAMPLLALGAITLIAVRVVAR